ncbi:MAG: type VII toxin-antitoxin system HepT family RNase toxin [Desulfotomaculales bacterium]
MTPPLTPPQKESVIRRLAFMQVELADLEGYENLTYEVYLTDRHKRRDVERLVENLANAAIDIAKIVLAGEGLEIPTTYRELFGQLARYGLVSPALAGWLGEFSRLRNVLAHQYPDIKWERLKRAIDEGPAALKDFMAVMEGLVEGTAG